MRRQKNYIQSQCSNCENGVRSDHCRHCNGSGEGNHDKSTCAECKGAGVTQKFCTCVLGKEAYAQSDNVL